MSQNPLRALLNRHLHTTGLSDLVLQVDMHTENLVSVCGSRILTINPQGFGIVDAEIPYHRVRSVHAGNTQIYP